MITLFTINRTHCTSGLSRRLLFSAHEEAALLVAVPPEISRRLTAPDELNTEETLKTLDDCDDDDMEVDQQQQDRDSSAVADKSVRVVEKKRFEVKKWNAVALWAWDIVVDNCAIC